MAILQLSSPNIENRKIAFVLEGRDASGKGGFLKFLLKEDVPHLVYHQGMPTKTRAKHWLSDYERVLPKKGQLIIFDRSWHTRSWVQPALGYCSKRQYENHIKKVKAWELKQEAKGIEGSRLIQCSRQEREWLPQNFSLAVPCSMEKMRKRNPFASN